MRGKKQDWEAYEVIFFLNLQSSATCNYLSTSSLTHSPNGPHYFTSKTKLCNLRVRISATLRTALLGLSTDTAKIKGALVPAIA